MAIFISDLQAKDSLLAKGLTAWEGEFGDHDGSLEISDLLSPRKSYAPENVSEITHRLEEITGIALTVGPGRRFHEDFTTYLSASLATLTGVSLSSIQENLLVKPDHGVSIGSSQDMGVGSFQIRAVTQDGGRTLAAAPLHSPPFIFLGLFGVTSGEIGTIGFEEDRPGDVEGYLKGKRSALALNEGMIGNQAVHVNPQAAFQVLNVPGLISTHADRSIDELERDGAPGLFLYKGYLDERGALLDRVIGSLASRAAQGRTAGVFMESLGENDLLVWKGAHRVKPEEFRRALIARFDAIKRLPGNPVIVRSGILPIHLLYRPVPSDIPGRVITGSGFFGYEIGPLPKGTMALAPIVEQTQREGYVLENDLLRPDEFKAFAAYISELQQIEDEVCRQYGAVLVRFEEEDLRLVLAEEGLFAGDGIHPVPALNTMLALARALSAREFFRFDPTPEVLDVIRETLGIGESDVREAFKKSSTREGLIHLVNHISHKPTPEPLSSEAMERAATLFSLVFNTAGRSREILNIVPFVKASVGGTSSPIALIPDMKPEARIGGGVSLSLPYFPLFELPLAGGLLGNAALAMEADYNTLQNSLPVRLTFGGTVMNGKGLRFTEGGVSYGYDPIRGSMGGRVYGRGGLGYDPSALDSQKGFGFWGYGEIGYEFPEMKSDQRIAFEMIYHF
ncbi:MAG: hypothetical protein Q7T11_07360 [Deltaproteobacteria bacterium]|nr:hypothetical protein [Deltaproteobacteria bacterium]